jgi:signal peptidase II
MAVKRLQLVLLITLIVAADQWTKQLARDLLPLHSRHFAGVLSLVYVENEGAFLSLGANLPRSARVAIFTIAVMVAVTAALFLLLTARVQGLEAVAVALIGAGGIGNLIDRIGRHGRVTDFLFLSAGPGSLLHTGVFNVADMAITGGVIWLLISSFMTKKEQAA